MKKILFILLVITCSCNDNEKKYNLSKEDIMLIYEQAYLKGQISELQGKDNFSQDSSDFIQRYLTP